MHHRARITGFDWRGDLEAVALDVFVQVDVGREDVDLAEHANVDDLSFHRVSDETREHDDSDLLLASGLGSHLDRFAGGGGWT